jgi:predicted transcriptional regulator
MVSIRAKIDSRVEKFLEVDYSGYRRAILCIFIKVKKATIDELHEMLSSKYSVSRNTVASMIGYIHSKLGILRAHKESYKTPMVYFLREEYMDLLMKIVTSSKKSSESTI